MRIPSKQMRIPASSIFWSILLSFFAGLLATVPASGQTVGNGTVFAPPAGAKEGYGINSDDQGSAPNYPSTHTRGGNGSGIGSSFIGTTSATAESSPAVSRPSFVADTAVQFHLPKLDSGFSEVSSNPALQMFNPSVPRLPRSSALVDPLANPFNKPDTFRPLEELPSFNKKRSVTEWMQF